MKKIQLILSLILCVTSIRVFSQGVTYDQGNEFIMAETKQMNQFFRRFNGEEDYEGKRFSTRDKKFHDPKLRQVYIPNLFNKATTNMADTLINNFIADVTDDSTPAFLYSRGGDWYAQLDIIISYDGKKQPCSLFLKMERENVGTKWVLTNVYFKPFITLFKGIDLFHSEKPYEPGPYLHPKSHEINFVNLKKAFIQLDEIEKYAANEYNPDFLTLFIYELKKKNAELLEIKGLKFHFFQVNNWYFEVSKFSRQDKNSGWLVSDLMRVAEKDKEILRKYIFYSDNNHLPDSP